MMPADFLWGAATSAYQIEGATHEDGRGQSIWDSFAAIPGKIADGSTGEPADDHYHRAHDDVALMREVGLRAYRFSVAWPRVQPQGRGRPNAAGLDFYDRLVELLLESGIRPFVTLYHWDLPQALQDRGGWTNRETIDRFADYADIVSHRLGDRVHDWITHNEPWVVAWLGHATGVHAPGLADPALYPRVAHNLLLSHGVAMPVVRSNVRGGAAGVGIVLNLSPVEPASERDEDERAALIHDGVLNRWYLDALCKGVYPADILERQPIAVETDELETIARPIDFLGVNYYSRAVVRMGPDGRPVQTRPDGEYTAMRWEVYPQGLYDLLTRLTRDYHPPALYVTENGAAFADVPGPDGAVHDPRRVAYLEAHVEQVARAVAAGVPLRGYFVWSLLDNWEWAEGYSKRFGLIYVDYTTQARTIKDSGHWYSRFIAREGGRT
jgi:beta-glucosidase